MHMKKFFTSLLLSSITISAWSMHLPTKEIMTVKKKRGSAPQYSLWNAVRSCNTKAVEGLLEGGLAADDQALQMAIKACCEKTRTTMMNADGEWDICPYVKMKTTDIIQLLLQYKAPIDNHSLSTALSYVDKQSDLELSTFKKWLSLIVTVENWAQKRALMHKKVLLLLLKAGAKPNALAIKLITVKNRQDIIELMQSYSSDASPSTVQKTLKIPKPQ